MYQRNALEDHIPIPEPLDRGIERAIATRVDGQFPSDAVSFESGRASYTEGVRFNFAGVDMDISINGDVYANAVADLRESFRESIMSAFTMEPIRYDAEMEAQYRRQIEQTYRHRLVFNVDLGSVIFEPATPAPKVPYGEAVANRAKIVSMLTGETPLPADFEWDYSRPCNCAMGLISKVFEYPLGAGRSLGNIIGLSGHDAYMAFFGQMPKEEGGRTSAKQVGDFIARCEFA